MRFENFIDNLQKLVPPIDAFKRLGYSDALAKQRLEGYQINASSKNTYLDNNKDELLTLISNYDCSKLEVGILSFNSVITQNEGFYFLGEAEGDILSLSKITGEVVVLDQANIEWIIWACASNGAAFLESILLAVEFFSKRILGEISIDDLRSTGQYVYLCSEAAGGHKYIDFFKMLLGYDG